jgi:hypothetical protein
METTRRCAPARMSGQRDSKGRSSQQPRDLDHRAVHDRTNSSCFLRGFGLRTIGERPGP